MEVLIFSRSEIIALYRRRAKWYDLTANLYYFVGFREWAYRKKAVRSLGLSTGDTVIEIGCGTGLNFEILQECIGPEGTIIGVDLTDGMLRQAQARIDHGGWDHVELVECDASIYQFPESVDGVISTFALALFPDFDSVIKSGATALNQGKCWVVADLRMPGNLFRLLYPLLLPLFRPFGVTQDLAKRHPWESLKQHLGNVHVDDYFLVSPISRQARKQRTNKKFSGPSTTSGC